MGREEIEDLKDKKITCKICGAEFVFTVGEQKFYRDRQLVSPPKRCPQCRQQRRATLVREVSHERQ